MSVLRAGIKKAGMARQERSAWLVGVLAALLWGLCASGARAGIVFTDVTKETGITFRHTDGSGGKFYIMETISAGLALFDYDNDGDIDIYFLNGAALKGTKFKVPPKNALYRNEGGWKFVDVTQASGTGDTGFGLGIAVGDYDNDGDPDIYLNNHGPNVLYRNNGDGTFTDVAKSAGVENGSKVGAGACFLDMDKDGDLDLYVSNYVEFSYETHTARTAAGFKTYPGPLSYTPTSDNLYRNNGDGTFTDVSGKSGVKQHLGTGMGMICSDYDNDGDTDIYVANDVMGNFLFQNDGTGKFEEVGLMSGVSYDLHGERQGSMGVEVGDYDNDGLFDFYATSFRGEQATLYRNLGDGMFEDVSRSSGAGKGTLPGVTWGAGLVDFDNDGDRDIFVASGHLGRNVSLFDDSLTYFQSNIFLMNTGDGKFVDMSEQCGEGMNVKLSSRGAGFDDLDNDGDVDVVILNTRREPTILKNDSHPKGHWLQVRLRGVKTNRDGVGARVTVAAGDLTLIDEVHSGRGYQSHYGTHLHFGLGKRDHVESIEVRWIGGGTDIFRNITADQLVELVEGKGK
jgi:hypothetical protein